MSIQTVLDSLHNGQIKQAKQQIKRLTYDQRVELIADVSTPEYSSSVFNLVVSCIVKRDFK